MTYKTLLHGHILTYGLPAQLGGGQWRQRGLVIEADASE